ncbi:hypothetical protein RP20_CCG015110 [Aedes albopictus]|nr:hypothetical protein RP20_CCG015110 [Aedes albopictus]
MVWCFNTVVILGVVVLKSSLAYSLYPGIFDPNPFIPKMNPQVLRITSSTLYDPNYGYDSSSGAKDDEAGYVRSNSEKGEGGFHHVETFQTKGGDDYEHEHENGYGESKNDADADYEDHQEPSVHKRDNNRDLKNDDRHYEVIEAHSNDHKNPNQHTTYGVKPTKAIKRPPVPEFGTRLTLPKKTTLKQNHNGYETVIYHGQENENSEKGYGRRNHHNAPPKTESFNEKHEEHDEEEVDDEEEERDTQDHDDDRDTEQSNYGDNYNSFKYDSEFDDFSKNFNDDADQGRSEEHDTGNDRKTSSSKNGYDYDDEVDREEVDEAANEDRYQGGEYDDDDDDNYGRHNRRHYDYASETDYDA